MPLRSHACEIATPASAASQAHRMLDLPVVGRTMLGRSCSTRASCNRCDHSAAPRGAGRTGPWQYRPPGSASHASRLRIRSAAPGRGPGGRAAVPSRIERPRCVRLRRDGAAPRPRSPSSGTVAPSRISVPVTSRARRAHRLRPRDRASRSTYRRHCGGEPRAHRRNTVRGSGVQRDAAATEVIMRTPLALGLALATFGCGGAQESGGAWWPEGTGGPGGAEDGGAGPDPAASDDDTGGGPGDGTPGEVGSDSSVDDAGTEDTGGVPIDCTPAWPDPWIGSPCASDGDCPYDGGVCLREDEGFPCGTCSLDCTSLCPDQDGAPETYCIDGADVGLGSTGQCLSQCDNALPGAEGCRDGYVCNVLTRFDATGAAGVCIPEAFDSGLRLRRRDRPRVPHRSLRRGRDRERVRFRRRHRRPPTLPRCGGCAVRQRARSRRAVQPRGRGDVRLRLAAARAGSVGEGRRALAVHRRAHRARRRARSSCAIGGGRPATTTPSAGRRAAITPMPMRSTSTSRRPRPARWPSSSCARPTGTWTSCRPNKSRPAATSIRG